MSDPSQETRVTVPKDNNDKVTQVTTELADRTLGLDGKNNILQVANGSDAVQVAPGATQPLQLTVEKSSRALVSPYATFNGCNFNLSVPLADIGQQKPNPSSSSTQNTRATPGAAPIVNSEASTTVDVGVVAPPRQSYHPVVIHYRRRAEERKSHQQSITGPRWHQLEMTRNLHVGLPEDVFQFGRHLFLRTLTRGSRPEALYPILGE